MEELDFSGLLANCSDKGRIGYNPIMMYAVVTYANMRGVRAVDRIVELCERDLAFIWLTKGQKPKRDAFYEFKNKKLTADVLDELNYQFLRRLQKEGFITLKSLFIDGTKIEANANRYTFVWRGTLNYHLAGLLDTVDSVYQKYNALIDKNEYGIKYDIPHAHMFVIEGMEKVRDVIEKNRTRKLTKHKKLSNNTIIEIDNCSPLEILKLQKNLMQIAEQEHITFVYGKGKRKNVLQRQVETLEDYIEKQKMYLTYQEMIGEHRSSCSKTDVDATFMRMKDDHMKNGQLKPGYNVQIGVEAEYIVHVGIFSSANDVTTLIPFLTSMESRLSNTFERVIADAGYESEENYAYLKENHQKVFIKPLNYEASKTRKYKAQLGKRENMAYDELTDTYTCANGRVLKPIEVKSRESRTGYRKEVTIYECETCQDCPLRSKCTKAKEGNHKRIEVSKKMLSLRTESLENIQSEEGIILRKNRSIQVEGAFGVLKQDYGFRKFLTRGKVHVTVEMLLLCFGYNVQKLHNKIQNNRCGQQLHTQKVA